MQTDELRQMMRRRPFQPFRVHLADGRVFNITKPYIHLMGQSYFDIGIPTDDGPLAVAHHWVSVPYETIQRLEQLTAPAASTPPRP